MLRTLGPLDKIEVMVRLDQWKPATCLSVGFSDIIAELDEGGCIMIPRTEPKHWRYRSVSQPNS